MASLPKNEEEESFVILGSSPFPSLAQNGVIAEGVESESITISLAPTLNDFNSIGVDVCDDSNGVITDSMLREPDAAKATIGKINSIGMGNVWGSGNAKDCSTSTQTVEEKRCPDMATSHKDVKNGPRSQPVIGDDSPAVSFILGKIDVHTLKTSIYSQFPSMCSANICPEEFGKLQSILALNLELKSALTYCNSNMKYFYDRAVTERDAMNMREAQYKTQLHELEKRVVSLSNENLELRHEIESNRQQLQLCTENQRKEHAVVLQAISEKTAQINNMGRHIENLEQQQLSSFDCIALNGKSDKAPTPSYVDAAEHERTVKDLERKMSELLAQNLDLTDVQKQNVDQMNCLQVNLVAAEEIIKQQRADMGKLESESDHYSQCKVERAEMREEMALLRQQLEVYSKDFVMERTTREGLSKEKDQLLLDLRLLQRKNQELIENQQRRIEAVEMWQQSGATRITANQAAFDASEKQRPTRSLPQANDLRNNHSCPVCWKSFCSLEVLMNHVDSCLSG